jgi:RNA polymerase sigma-70 factor (ECF subfamily)
VDDTAILLQRIRNGDERAREELARAYLPVAKRLAHGRLPASARGLSETDDIASRSVTQAVSQAVRFEMRHEAAFLVYLRRIVINEIRSEIRRAKARPSGGELDTDLAWSGPSPLDNVIGRELMNRYERALDQLTALQREAVVLRLEFRLGFREIATKMGLDSPDAARMLVSRALVRLASLIAPQDGSS